MAPAATSTTKPTGAWPRSRCDPEAPTSPRGIWPTPKHLANALGVQHILTSFLNPSVRVTSVPGSCGTCGDRDIAPIRPAGPTFPVRAFLPGMSTKHPAGTVRPGGTRGQCPGVAQLNGTSGFAPSPRARGPPLAPHPAPGALPALSPAPASSRLPGTRPQQPPPPRRREQLARQQRNLGPFQRLQKPTRSLGASPALPWHRGPRRYRPRCARGCATESGVLAAAAGDLG